MAYVTSIVGIPTSNITLEERTYTVNYKICITPDNDLNYPQLDGLWNDALLWPRALSINDILEIPEIYDMTGVPSDPPGMLSSEIDDDAILRSFTPGEFARDALPPDCMCCRFAEATYSAEIFRGADGVTATSVGELINLCPRLDVIPTTRDQRVEIAKFLGYFFQDRTCPSSTCGPDIESLIANKCGNLQLVTAVEIANLDLACHPFVINSCRTPMMPNGVVMDMFRQITDKILRIRKYRTEYGDAVAFGCHENTVNCDDLRINLPCINFDYTFPAGTLYLHSVAGSPLDVNGANAWDREYELHFRLCGWDDVFPLEGVERASCDGELDGKFDKEAGCAPGRVTDIDDCLEEGLDGRDVAIPSRNAIRDVEGNPIRTPHPLDPFGRPLSRTHTRQYYSKWRKIDCSDFTTPALELPGAQTP